MSKTQKTSSFCTSTTPIPAEGRVRTDKNAKNLELLHLDRRSAQRAARAYQKTLKKHFEFLHLDHADPRRGFIRAPQKRKKNSSFCTSTTPIPAEGRARTDKNAKHFEFLHLDHADPRRGSHSRSLATSPPPAKKEILNTELFLFLSRALST